MKQKRRGIPRQIFFTIQGITFEGITFEGITFEGITFEALIP